MRSEHTTHSPDRIISYFRMERTALLLTTITGLIYNFGLLATPWFEGKLAGCLMDILGGTKKTADMLTLVIFYILTVCVVQGARYVKRFYVRRFANNINRSMKKVLYANLINLDRSAFGKDGTGEAMTKALSDVDDCAEGMRKFTTEVFDTGVALVGYIGMLIYYDPKLALICLIFPPISYIIAEKMKFLVQLTGAEFKKSASRLNAATLDRVSNAVTYRIFGCEQQRGKDYEEHLADYEKKAVRANIWVSSMPALYRVICMAGVIFIIYFGSANMHRSVGAWDIAAFTTFLSCYTKLSVKSSKAAKLFNSVHKAEVSWERIKPLMKDPAVRDDVTVMPPCDVKIKDLSFTYPDGKKIFSGLSLNVAPGEIIGITGPVACGKSTLGRAFLNEAPYGGSLRVNGKELSEMSATELSGTVGYLGHDPELQSDNIENNVALGDSVPTDRYLHDVCLDGEIAEMPDGKATCVGSSGVRLSGGQAQRLALARTLYHKRPVMVLDDPFSALDRHTEEEVFENLRRECSDSVVFLISHRLYKFPETDLIIWMDDGKTICGTHEELMQSVPQYRELYNMQKDGEENEKE